MRWLRTLEEILWPRGLKCLCCDELSEGALLCQACLTELHGMRLPAHLSGDDLVRSVYRYDGRAKELVLLLKMNCVADAAKVLAQGMADTVRELKLPPETVLTWVTMPERRRRERGVDHGHLLCQAVSELTGLPVRRLIVRTGRARTQRGLTREARLHNLSGTMTCCGRIDVPVLLIDDVLTTGATVSACASVLMAAGAPGVYAVTAAKAMLHPND